MYGNNFNPYMYQPYYQTSNLSRGFGGFANSSIRASTGLSGTTLTNGGKGSVFGLGKNLLGKFSFSGFLNGASKTLNVVNQAIPIFYQVKPMFNNAKTMLRIMGAVKDDGSSNKTSPKKIINNSYYNQQVIPNNNSNTYKGTTTSTESSSYIEENPTFFI